MILPKAAVVYNGMFECMLNGSDIIFKCGEGLFLQGIPKFLVYECTMGTQPTWYFDWLKKCIHVLTI